MSSNEGYTPRDSPILSSSLVGWSVGGCCPSRSSLSMWRRVVFPALSRPRKTSLPLFFHSPRYWRTPKNQSHRNISLRYKRYRTNDVIEVHCYFVDIGWTDCEQIRSRINNNDCRTFNMSNTAVSLVSNAIDKDLHGQNVTLSLSETFCRTHPTH